MDHPMGPSFTALLRRPRPLRRQFWLSPGATIQDIGFFGPKSVAWRLHSDVSFVIGGYRALLIEALHPLAVAAVEQHGQILDDPWRRLWRTSQYVFDVTFGDRATALAAARRVRAIHRVVSGTDCVTGRDYSAEDPTLLLWVHAVFVDSILTAFDEYGAGLANAQADQYVTEMVTAATLVGVPSERAPQNVAELRSLLAETSLMMTPGAARVRELVLHPPISWKWRPLAMVLRASVLAILPGAVSDIYSFSSSERRHRIIRMPIRTMCRTANVLARLPFPEDMFASAS